METQIMVRMGELSTKGRNKKYFINQLARNIRHQFKDHPEVHVTPEHDFIFLHLNGLDDKIAIERLEIVFGISSFSTAYVFDRDVDLLKEQAIKVMKEEYPEAKTFKVATSRSDRYYELDSNDINQTLGAAVLEALPHLKVQMKQPDVTLRVKVRNKKFVLSTNWVKGAGGMPVGTAGHGALMLSGGLDSPVAGYLAMKRGVRLHAVHFASPPHTSQQSLDKTKKLASILAEYGEYVNFITVPFTEIQEEIKEKTPSEYLMTITRRFMMKLTEMIAIQQDCKVIINGESIGQVASQTLESMLVINEVTNYPVVRPLVTMDKNEIIEIAEKIGTYETSIQPYDDCCTVFAPPSPKTKPKLEDTKKYEQALDVEGLLERAFNGITIEKITPESFREEEDNFADLL